MSVFNNTLVLIMLSLTPTDYAPKPPILLIGGFDEDSPTHRTVFDEISTNKAKAQVLVLSGKYGLLRNSLNIMPSDFSEIPDDKAAIRKYLKAHKTAIANDLEKLIDTDRDIYIFLAKKQLNILEACFPKGRFKAYLSKFRKYYVFSEREDSSLTEALKRVLVSMHSTPYPYRIYRSGVSNVEELAYCQHANPVGVSLHYVNTKKNLDLLHAILKYAESVPVFIDNGIVSKLAVGQDVDTGFVFEEYEKIIRNVTQKTAKNITLVIPDSPFNPSHAIKLIRQNRQSILFLLSRCKLILPIHKTYPFETIKELVELLNCHKNIVLGVPCLQNKNADLRLSLDKIESLFRLKVSLNGKRRPAFKAVHFLGMSEFCASSKLKPRLMLSQIYNVKCSLDAGRTVSVFGYYQTKDGKKGRAAERLKPHIKEADKRAKVLSSSTFQNHNLHSELHHPQRSGLVTRDFYHDMGKNPEEFAFKLSVILGQHVVDAAMSQLNGTQLEKLAIFVTDKSVATAILEALKVKRWERFLPFVNVASMHSKELRFEALRILNYRAKNIPQQGMLFNSMFGATK
ncbi:hypothetical protein [Vibrio penaeicida]|uniref:hypothetical protein n=1 Tax=Vibrio penaeicida TaxID=104609 RepID=UPI001CC751A8|nr:hypothetical protein [Vibrio penaeicida]